MLLGAIVLFIIGAIFGLVVLSAILRNKKTPKFFVLMHGFFVGVALLILVTFAASGHFSGMLATSLVLFFIAALGGLTLLTIDLSNKPIPKAIALLHPVIALAGLITLIIYVVQLSS